MADDSDADNATDKAAQRTAVLLKTTSAVGSIGRGCLWLVGIAGIAIVVFGISLFGSGPGTHMGDPLGLIIVPVGVIIAFAAFSAVLAVGPSGQKEAGGTEDSINDNPTKNRHWSRGGKILLMIIFI